MPYATARTPGYPIASSQVVTMQAAAHRHYHRAPSSGLRTQTGRSRRVAMSAGGSGGREPWEFGRFVKTVAFFNEGWLQKRLQGLFSFGSSNTQASGSGAVRQVPVAPLPPAVAQNQDPLDPIIPVPIDGVILVTGATGGVGRRVVRKLLAAGKTVRAVVRDVQKANELLSNLPAASGARLQLVAADLTQARTLLPEYVADVRAVVSCAAVKVQPKEGDDARRSKYMQGIKFYDPEVVGDTPEAVELKGMQNLLAALGPRLGLTQGLPLLQVDGSDVQWGPLDDVVMGGVSVSRIARVDGASEDGGPAMVFSGKVSTSNSGGFASVRSRNYEPPVDVSSFTGIELRVKGNGQRFKLILRPDSNWDGVGYTASFNTQAGAWQTVRIPFDKFVPVFRARTVTDGKPFEPSHLYSVQLMLSKFEYDGQLNPSFQAGEFELPISKLAAYIDDTTPPRFVHVSSAGVTRPNRPGIDVEQEPPAVKMNTMLGGLLDFKLAGEDALRASGVPYAIIRPCALTEEPRGMPLQFDQGDTIKGKVGREDIAELCCALLSEPCARGTTCEVKSTVPFSQPWQVDPVAPPAVRDWSSELQAAKLVPGVTGKTINGQYTGKQPESQVLGTPSLAATR